MPLDTALKVGSIAEMGSIANELSVTGKEMGAGDSQGGISELMKAIGEKGGGNSWTGSDLSGNSSDDEDDDSQ